MGQSFLDLARVKNSNYCRHYCAKCYLQFIWEFIEPIEKNYGTIPEGKFPSGMGWNQIMEIPGVQEHLAQELENLPLLDFLQLKCWDGLLSVSFAMLNGDAEKQNRILSRWLESCPKNVRFIDVVVFYLLPHANASSEIQNKWFDKAVEMAVSSQDYSLIESLVWRLRVSLDKYPELLALATELQKNSPAIAKALNSRNQS